MFFMFFGFVNAKSEYYDFVWEHDWVDNHEISGIIDAVDTDNGFIAVGFAGSDPVEYAIMSFNKDGSYTIPKEYVDKWTRQINTSYDELSEQEKDSQ